MRVNTNLELLITISDIDEIYTRDYDEMLIHHAKLVYEKKCFQNMFIDSINRVIKRSIPTIVKRDIHNCKFRLYAIFDIDIIKYDEYDIIVGAKVMDVIQKGRIDSKQDVIICKTDHATILINHSNILSTIEKNQIIPVVVGGVNYNTMKPTILINAYPFVPMLKEKKVYKIDSLTSENIQYLEEYVFTKLNSKIDEMKEIVSSPKKKKRWDFFVDLLYPYKKKKYSDSSDTKKSDKDKISIFDTTVSGYVLLSDEYPLHEMEFIKTKETDDCIVEKAINVYEIFIMDVIKHIDTVNQLTLTYLDDAVFDSHQNIFNIYKDNKYE